MGRINMDESFNFAGENLYCNNIPYTAIGDKGVLGANCMLIIRKEGSNFFFGEQFSVEEEDINRPADDGESRDRARWLISHVVPGVCGAHSTISVPEAVLWHQPALFVIVPRPALQKQRGVESLLWLPKKYFCVYKLFFCCMQPPWGSTTQCRPGHPVLET